MEIRIVLESVEPLAGCLGVVGDTPIPGNETKDDIPFSGWLGLLRALYEVTGGPGGGALSGP